MRLGAGIYKLIDSGKNLHVASTTTFGCKAYNAPSNLHTEGLALYQSNNRVGKPSMLS